MVSSNKILTVSYGTFSCTLEGFDNSFDTMKAIAEYFRDLAQDDRYFGAEPPTPDAEMLARIAEREIERRVEARFEKGNLVLRPSDDAEPPHGDVAPKSSTGAALVGATAGGAASSAAVADTTDEVDTDDREEPAIEDAMGDETMDADDTVEAEPDVEDIAVDTDSVELAEIEDIDTASDNDDAVEEIAIDLSGLSLDTEDDIAVHADDVLTAEDTSPVESSIDDLIAEQGVKADRLADAAAQEARDAAELAEIDEPALSEVEEVAEAPVVTDSVADKLQRIRAVVASKAQAAPDYIEDEHAMSGPDGDGNDDNDAMDPEAGIPGFVEAAEFDDDMLGDDLDDDEDNLFADTIAAVVNDQIDADQEDDEDDATLPAASSDGDDQSEPSDAQRELETLRAKIALLEAQAAAKAPTAADESDDFAETDDAVTAMDDDSDDAPLAVEDTREPLVARVAKAKRSDVEAALAAGEIEEYDEDEESDAAAASQPLPGREGSTLTPEQEAELARELADLHAEIEEDDDWNFDDDEDSAEDDDAPILSEEEEEVAQANIRKAVKMTSPGRAMLTDTKIEEDDDSVERLADKTETEMDEPEGNRRRSAIAHLRAAVAATKADRILGFGKKTVNEEEPYREDLADAVRPRRPKVTEARSARPAPVRPAPLKLVAEQRIDVESANEGAPVRPRRVLRSADTAEAPESIAADDTGFADFAESQGAHTLPELLEAAAAYMSFVEGRDQFSRPQLMTKLLQAEGEASSREERLRSFGQLLRDGKIEKKGGGRFAASENIGFKPNERAAG
ncbi:hypothetical protein [uncultured Marivita sp.]|uniref:hypothetical protein n=1 Tax=uncultured Marivita sp. TaxID=888080 RepID=UPI0026241FB9|nr:hypothetical protein [uncultured Marivita sp.]